MDYKYEWIDSLFDATMTDTKGRSHHMEVMHLLNVETEKKVYTFSVNVIDFEQGNYSFIDEYTTLTKAIKRLDLYMFQVFHTK